MPWLLLFRFAWGPFLFWQGGDAIKLDELSPEERLIAEQLAMTQGRELIRRMLQVSLDEQAREVEKKRRRAERANAD